MKSVNIQEQFSKFAAYWSPKIVGEVNDCYVKVFKAKGEFVWHSHPDEDEFFLVVKGELKIRFRDGEERLREGEFLIVPRGVEHLPIAEAECHVLLFEPKGVVNTGDAESDRRVEADWLY